MGDTPNADSVGRDETGDEEAIGRSTQRPPMNRDSVIIQVEVPGTKPESWWLLVTADGATHRPGRNPDAQVVFTTDPITAAGIRNGSASAQAAFMEGRLRIGGDPRVLETARALIQRAGPPSPESDAIDRD